MYSREQQGSRFTMALEEIQLHNNGNEYGPEG